MIMGWFKITLWKRILGALILGLIVGLLWGDGAHSIRWMGDIFVRAIRMLVVPLIFTTLVAGVVSMGDARRLGSIGLKAFVLYLGTTALAITIGLIFGTIMQPGVGVELSAAEPHTLSSAVSLGERLINMIPINPIAALAEGNILAVIIFSILIGV